MTLSTLASIASVLSSVAICASLIYLAVQVQQSDRNQRTLLQQATSARTMETIWKFALHVDRLLNDVSHVQRQRTRSVCTVHSSRRSLGTNQ